MKEKFEKFIKINNLSSEYVFIRKDETSKRGEVILKHTICGNEFSMSSYDFMTRNRRCPNCFRAHRKTTSQFKQDVLNIVGDEYTVLGKYENNKEKIKMKHEECGHEYEVQPNKFLSGSRCPNCFGTPKKTTEIFNEEVKLLTNGEYELIGDYENNNEKVKIAHLICGHEYNVVPSNFIQGTRCPNCFGTPKKTTEEFNEEIKLFTNGEYELVGEYEGRRNNATFKHKKCGTEFNITAESFYQGTRCPECKDWGSSKAEREVREYIKTFYKNRRLYSNRIFDNGEKKYELDIYLPSKKIGIEFDGLYWHSEEKVGKKYQIDKTNYFKKKDIRLIHIFEDEWKYKKDIVKSKIRHILGYSESERVYARKCNIKEVESKEAREFLDENHIQGKDSSSRRLGLYYENELVSIMTFGKQRLSLGSKNSKENSYELIRFASSKNVIGGFSRLLKNSIKKYNIEHIKTFADLRYSSFDKNVYDTNGFKLSHISAPSYWYFKGNELIRYHRFIFRKQEVARRFPDNFDISLTEYENMQNNKYHRIWDCGNLVYEMVIEKDVNINEEVLNENI